MHMIVYTYDPFNSVLFALFLPSGCLKFVLSNDLLNTRNSSVILVLVDNIAFKIAQTRCRRRPSFQFIHTVPRLRILFPSGSSSGVEKLQLTYCIKSGNNRGTRRIRPTRNQTMQASKQAPLQCPRGVPGLLHTRPISSCNRYHKHKSSRTVAQETRNLLPKY
ncbi:hypothetical protein ASPFODRAFT_488236 [Aspergillus luchuensis CBS 106.47]|uniref:Uncharacterized protein n=1 Tax=Aspergillus luchuensis (strain CBS 106.47) TaxID=1137211 RepID=A0A1M3TQZ0_ASPLC|nr:hypothetical protein ASPFODRAFT_488236 [Aspergillus luchuensis CBS 106.47]